MFTKTVLSTSDIMAIVDVGRDKARRIKNEVIAFSVSKGRLPISNRKCLTTDFAELYGISIDQINLLLKRKRL